MAASLLLSAAMGVYSIYQANQASNAADKQQAKADALAADQLAFSKQQLADWEQAYGGLEDNLSNYYNNLNVGDYTAQSLQQFEQEKNKSMTALRQNLAQRGLESSGLSAGVELQSALQGAQGRAQIRQQAPAQVAAQQQSFLQLGMQRNPADNVQSVLNTQATTQANLANDYNQAAGKATQAATDAVGTVFDQAAKDPIIKAAITNATGGIF